ncbi:MAG: shikimate kinase [Prolixibacteraceae bacterium]|jgi:shikimate kinase|nr:shikimate kinase [Prolixibacteraceae bacterium]MBT6764024.1 shikimate kinase [Prolixibacteraceae bacterium]MBT6997741.1 shikimate kinase [Prolixibacteraceae bacterium]MBT7396487.1 shikimate kinase [Prolixibacteraceae bacterium]
MRIYLIGYMGCGKSTLGRRLSEHLNLQFVDMDHYIEERNYKTIPQIFAEEGEAEFRKKERKALEELSEFTDIVIATGGGAPCFFDNVELMNKSGKTIYLNIEPNILADRLLKSKTERPLIKGKSREELVAFIDETLKKRNEFYKQAKLEITQPDINLHDLQALIS